MTRFQFALVSFLGIALPPYTFAAPRLPEKPRMAISATNAEKLKPIRELEVSAHRIVRGPAHGELSFVCWEKSVEVVSDSDFRPLRKLANGKRVVQFSSSRDASHFAWGENSTGVVLQNVSTGKTVEINAENSQPNTAFHPDGKLFATGGYGTHVKLWDMAGGAIREMDCGTKGGLWPIFSRDGKTLAVGNRNDDARLFEVSTGKLLHTLPKKWTQELAFSPDGKKLAVGYVDGTISLWDVAKGELLHAKVSGGTEVYTLDWSPKGDLLVTAGLAGKIVIWDPRELTIVRQLDAPGWVICTKFTADGSRLLCSGAQEGSGTVDRKIVVWGLPDGTDR